jgi:catechol 2,3-dioxygenase-like lactoylglutathione lyase family enzyme
MISRRLLLATTGGALAAHALTPYRVATEPVPGALDHIILGVSDLDRGIDFVEQRSGVRGVIGGVHPGRGTRNALVSLGGRRYLEIMAPDPQQPAELETRGLRKLTEPRIVGWAVHPVDAQALARKLTEQGVAFTGPDSGSRKRPDGRVLNWKTLTLKDDFSGLLPFFIEWSADSLHPSEDSPKGCRLIRFIAHTPKPEELVPLTLKIGLDLPVNKDGVSQLRATIASAKGEFLIAS